MFDNISVSDKLPFNDEMVKLGLDKNVYSFQTKDLHCSLDTYFIQGGKLLEQKYKETTWIEKKDDLFGGYLDKQEPYLVDTQYHGTLNFYHIQAVDNLDCWIEYNAVFTNGVMEKVELVKFKTTDNTESRKRLEAIFEEAKVRRGKWYNKYIFDTSIWRKGIKQVARFLRWLELSIGYIRIKLP